MFWYVVVAPKHLSTVEPSIIYQYRLDTDRAVTLIECLSSSPLIEDRLIVEMQAMEQNNQNIPDVRFLEGCVDECAINGDIIVRDHTFSYGRPQWNPKVLDWEPNIRSRK